MKLHINSFIFGLAILLSVGCAPEQDSYTQTITNTEGLANAKISYTQNDSIIYAGELSASAITYNRIADQNVTVKITDESGTTTFTDVPSKYINLDAEVEVTRNVFQDYFPKEWAPMKGQPYTTLYLKSKQDIQVFYMKCVMTNTDKEIGKYSEDF
jgi:hypothetical protein